MSNGEITQDNMVVVTRGTGRYYVSKKGAAALAVDLNSDECPRMVTVNGHLIASADIVGIVTPIQIDEMEKRKRGMWQCGKASWHGRDEVCKCGWGEQPRKTDLKDPEMTPEQKERSELILQFREKGWTLKQCAGLRGKTNEQLKEMLK